MNVDALIETAGWWSYLLLFLMTAGETSAFAGLLLPGETFVLLASAVASQGDLNVLIVAVAVVAGGITGDNLGYALGHRWGRHAHARPATPTRFHRSIDRARTFLAHHGGAAVVTGRFIGFVRSFVPFAAGAFGMPYRRFFLYSAIASLSWGVGNVLLGYYAGAAADRFLHSVGLIGAAVLAAVAVVIVAAVWVLKRRRRGRVPVPSPVVASSRALRSLELDSPRVLNSSKE
ncbi:DedA family protein [Streptomyces sp. NPDC007084]|uniref:DedA family protein n=1 Tax=Streptomyces sp. NPDC007084 TaxID=3154313 RepID=UPI0034512D16